MAAHAAALQAAHEETKLDCIHCGICLSVCPTYLQLGSEVDSPRGRIYLINALKEGRVSATSESFERHMSLCLECRACETACPSGVRFSVMMNEARAEIRAKRFTSQAEDLIRYIIFNLLLPSRRLLRLNFRLLRFYQKIGLQHFVRRTNVLRLFPVRLQNLESLLPEVPRPPTYNLPRVGDPSAQRRVSLFEGCIMPMLFGPVNEATVRVLRRNRVFVCSPAKQTCCGALHLHDGEKKLAEELARRNIEAFEKDGADFIVVNAAGCGAMLKEYGHLLHDNANYAGRARAFAARVKDISEYLDMIGITRPTGRLPMKVTYDDPCHLLHGQGIRAAPRNLLRSIPGLQLVELPYADQCCGSAGIYNITQPEMSSRILEEKISNIISTGAHVIATGNPGCLLQIRSGAREKKLTLSVVHPIQLLDQAYEAAPREPLEESK